jgi:hypothetical protein
MGSEMMYAVVLGLLGLLSTALVAKACLAHLDGACLRLAKIVGDAEGFAQRQAAFTASKQGPATAPESPLASTPAPAAAHLAAEANLKQ